jgi:hypothetical protein
MSTGDRLNDPAALAIGYAVLQGQSIPFRAIEPPPSETPPEEVVTLGAGWIVHVKGFPFRLLLDTMASGQKKNLEVGLSSGSAGWEQQGE